MTGSNIAALPNARAPERVPNAVCIAALEEALEAARSGEIVGIAFVPLYHDNTATYNIAGFAGGNAMIGALAQAQHILMADID